MNNIKKSLKTCNGITLIALVITIIVLLILAGISISMLTGNNGILQKATDAKEKTEIEQVVEYAKLDVLAQIAENNGKNITKEQLKAILNKYFENINNLEIPDDLSNSNIILNANQNYGGYNDIELSKIYNGKLEKDVNQLEFSVNGVKISARKGQTWYDKATNDDDLDNIRVDVMGHKLSLRYIILQSHSEHGENGMIRTDCINGQQPTFGKFNYIKIASKELKNINLALSGQSSTLYDSNENIQYCNTEIITGEEYSIMDWS